MRYQKESIKNMKNVVSLVRKIRDVCLVKAPM